MKPAGSSWRRYIRSGLGRRLSVLGERLGWDWLVYNRFHFDHFHETALDNAPGVIGGMLSALPTAHRFLDVGAGSGAFAAELTRRGRVAIACEHNNRGRALANAQGVDARRFDLNADPPTDVSGPFDVAYCFEVAEHLPPYLGDKLVRFLCGQAPVVVFTAAHTGQGGTGHINEQPKDYWLQRFVEAGFESDPAATDNMLAAMTAARVPGHWFFDNLFIVRRTRV